MKWQQYLKSFDPKMSDEDFSHILWTWTGYPMRPAPIVIKQFSSHVRAQKHGIRHCWFCEVNRNFKHRKWCPTHKGESVDSMP